MYRYKENRTRATAIARAREHAHDSRPLLSGPGRSVLGSLFIWFVAPFVAYLMLVGVLGILVASMETLAYFAVPTNVALLTSLLVTAAFVKLIFNAVCRLLRTYTPD